MSKLILIDSDETLRRSDGVISTRTKQAIKKLREQGNFIIVATGRPRYHAKQIMEESGATPIIIASNGSDIYDVYNDKSIDSRYLNNDECLELMRLSIENNLRIVFTVDDIEYVTKYVKNDNQILLDINDYKEILSTKKIKQCIILFNTNKDIEKILELINSSNNLKIINGILHIKENKTNWLSIGNKNTSKGYALKKISEYLNIDIEKTIAIGNDYNDISMLDAASFSIAVSNAFTDVKKHADYITKSNDEDGVAIVLEKIYKNSLR